MVDYDNYTNLRIPEQPPVNTLWTGVEQLSKHIKIVDAKNGGRVIVIKGTKQDMSKEEIINKWQLLLDNYQTLELLFGYDKETLNAIAPDKELIEETIRLLKEREQENERLKEELYLERSYKDEPSVPTIGDVHNMGAW